jgi:hypothetical protein
MESFILSNKAIVKKSHGEEYVRQLGEAMTEILSRLDACEAALSEIGDRLDRKLEF